MKAANFLQTGQTLCFDNSGLEIPCVGTGQDAEHKYGIAWPIQRFELDGELVLDLLTELVWPQNANLSEYPLTWQEALNFVIDMNKENVFGFNDWRLPNRRELRSLMSYQAKKPALTTEPPFKNVFLGWYWTSTTAAINPHYAWYIHMEGARMFYGRKDQYYLCWPVRGTDNNILPQTGQKECFDSSGALIDSLGTGQDGEYQLGSKWPEPRFDDTGEVVIDKLTNLCWLKKASITDTPVNWSEAFKAIEKMNKMNKMKMYEFANWQLPNINALESLVDCSQYDPALLHSHPFEDVKDVYWSSTTSYFKTDWAWALYLNKGALGVDHKSGKSFFVWPVCYYEPKN